MLFRLLKYPFLLLCLLPCFALVTQAQLIRTTPPVPAEVQILLQLDEVHESWLVENSLERQAGENPVIIGAPKLSEEEVKSQLRSLNGVGDFSLYEQVRKYISLFTEDKRQHSEAVLGLQKYYAPQIDPVIRRRNLPFALRYLPAALSGFNTFVRGEEQTAGMWRLHYHAALRYGLNVDEVRDERHDPVRSTEAALSYLTDLYHQFGDWNLAIFAYVCGPANLNKARLRIAGKANKLATLYEFMPVDSRDFFPAYVAHAYLAQFYGRWGMKPLNIQAPPQTASVSIREPLHKASVVKVLGISNDELRFCNPTLWGKNICKGEEISTLNLPVGMERRFETERTRIFAAENANRSAPTQPEVAPVVVAKPIQSKPKPIPKILVPPAGSKELTYTIQPGDNLGAIAAEFNVSVSKLQAWNSLAGTMIRAGEELKVYVAKDKVPVKKTIVPQTKSKEESSRKFSTYTVKSGDTFWSISQKYPGTNHLEIMEFNQEGSALQPGQVIRIPNSQ